MLLSDDGNTVWCKRISASGLKFKD